MQQVKETRLRVFECLLEEELCVLSRVVEEGRESGDEPLEVVHARSSLGDSRHRVQHRSLVKFAQFSNYPSHDKRDSNLPDSLCQLSYNLSNDTTKYSMAEEFIQLHYVHLSTGRKSPLNSWNNEGSI